MSQNINVSHVQQYKANLIAKYQQEGSKLRDCVSYDADIQGKHFFADLLGPTNAVKKTTRHGDTPLVDSPHSRRRGSLETYEWADLIDKADIVRMLINPQSAYVVNASNAMGRSVDDEIILAFNADALEGETGGSVVSLPAAQKIAHGSAGLTLAKIVQSSKILNAANVPMEGRYFAYSPAGLEDVLNDGTITDADFNTVRLLMAGTIDQFMGYVWKISTRLPLSGTTRKCFAWHRDAMVLAEPEGMFVDVGPRRDKSLSTQVFVEGHFGAVRRQDEGLVEVEITE